MNCNLNKMHKLPAKRALIWRRMERAEIQSMLRPQCWGCDVAGIFQRIYRLQRPHMWLWQAWRGLDKLLRVWIKEIRKPNSHLFTEETRTSEVDTYLIKSKRIAKKKVNTCVLFKQTTSIRDKNAAIFWILSPVERSCCNIVRFPNCIVYSWVYNTQKTVKFNFDCFHSLH